MYASSWGKGHHRTASVGSMLADLADQLRHGIPCTLATGMVERANVLGGFVLERQLRSAWRPIVSCLVAYTHGSTSCSGGCGLTAVERRQEHGAGRRGRAWRRADAVAFPKVKGLPVGSPRCRRVEREETAKAGRRCWRCFDGGLALSWELKRMRPLSWPHRCGRYLASLITTKGTNGPHRNKNRPGRPPSSGPISARWDATIGEPSPGAARL